MLYKIGLTFVIALLGHTAVCHGETAIYEFTPADFEITKSEGVTYVKAINGNVSYGEPEEPMLPVMSSSIMCPYNMDMTDWSYTGETVLVGTDVELRKNSYPMPTSVLVDNIETEIYAESFDRPVTVSEGINGIQGVGYKSVFISPFRYDSATKRLYLYTRVQVNINWESALRWDISPRVVHIESSVALEIEVGDPKILTYPAAIQVPDDKKLDYLIVTVDSLKAALKELLVWRRSIGLRAEMVSVEDICREVSGDMDLPLRIKTYLYRRYLNNGLEYVTLVGDVNQVPTRYCYAEVSGARGSSDYIPADVYYTAFDNDFTWDTNGDGIYGQYPEDKIDWYADIVISRIPINNCKEIQKSVKKILSYEKFYDKYTESPKILYCGASLSNPGENMWGDISDSHGMAIQVSEMCEGANVDADFFFDTGSSIEGLNYSSDNFFKALQSEYEWVFEISHGNFESWSQYGFYFHDYDSERLENTHKHIVATLACNTAGFDKKRCLGTSFLKNPKGGAIGYIGSSRYGWVSTNCQYAPSYAHLIMSYMMKDYCSSMQHRQRLGDVFNVLKTKYGPVYYNDTYNAFRWLYFSHQLIGDAATQCFNISPKNVNIEFRWIEDNILNLELPTYDWDGGKVVLVESPENPDYNISEYPIGAISYAFQRAGRYSLSVLSNQTLPVMRTIELVKNEDISDSRNIEADIVNIDDVNLKSSSNTNIQSSAVRINTSFHVEPGCSFKISIN